MPMPLILATAFFTVALGTAPLRQGYLALLRGREERRWRCLEAQEEKALASEAALAFTCRHRGFEAVAAAPERPWIYTSRAPKRPWRAHQRPTSRCSFTSC